MSIVLSKLSKRYGNHDIVDELSLEIHTGEFFVLLGSSGSGKSTVLKMIAGLLSPDLGRIFLDGDEVTGWIPQKRRVGFVFQNYSIFQHMSVAENIEFGMKIRKMNTLERTRRRDQLLQLVGLAGFESRYADQLSGGQQQRVALARALAYQPKVLLLDEPFAALDEKTRTQLRRSIKGIQRRLGITTILVTHDQEEAFELADRIGIIERGKLLEVGPAEDLYRRPKSHFAATFLGNGTVLIGNIMDGVARFGSLCLPLPATVSPQEGAMVQLLFRPEQVTLLAEQPSTDLVLLGRGEIIDDTFSAGTRRIRLRLPHLPGTRQISPPLPPGERIMLVETILPADAQPADPQPWVCLKGWHILEQPSARLLVYDETNGPLSALATARQIATRLKVAVTILGIASNPETADDLPGRLRRRQKKAKLPAADLRLRYGNPILQVTSEQNETIYDLMILSIKPRRFGRLDPRPSKIGLGVLQILENASIPVLIVNGECRWIDRLVFATPSGEFSKTDIQTVGRLAKRLDVPITLLHMTRHAENLTGETRSFLEKAVTILQELKTDCELQIRESSSTVEGIRAELRTGKHELIVTGREALESTDRVGRGSPFLQGLLRHNKPILFLPGKDFLANNASG